MTVEKGLHPISPVHVHIEDDVPVHVHLKQPKSKGRLGVTAGNSHTSQPRRSTASSRAKSRSVGTELWVPPPGKANKSQKISWQAATHRLETNQPRDGQQMSDLSTEKENQVQGQMKNYEKRIDSLMTEMGTLKNEAELQRAIRHVERKEEMLDASRRVMEEQERELFEYKEELNVTEQENKLLRKSMDLLQDETNFSVTEKDLFNSEREALLKKLIEVEMDGQAASSQIAELKDMLCRLRDENRVSASDSNRLTKQKELLLEKLADFETTNRTLRRLLREQHRQETVALRLSEQRDTLVKKLADGDRINEKLRLEMRDKDGTIIDLQHDLAAHREQNLGLSRLQGSLENTQAHLQKELRTKEGDCNHMAVQIRSIESHLAQSKIDVGRYQELLANAKEKAGADKEALKKANRVQKQRAARSEDAVEQLNSQLLEHDTFAEELRLRLDQTLASFDKVSKENSQIEAENSALKMRSEQLEHIMSQSEHSAKSQVELLTTQLHEQASDASQLKLENERLKSSIATINSKFQQADGELVHLRENLKQYENLVEDYRDQKPKSTALSTETTSVVNCSRRETDETIVKLGLEEKEKHRIERDGDIELEKVKQKLHQRLQELEPLPEMLKETELRLHENQEEMIYYQKQNSENTMLIADLTAKVELITINLEQMKSKLHSSRDENQHLNGRIDTFEKKYRDAEAESHDLNTKLTLLEEKLHQNSLKLEDKRRENTSLTRQLENALTDVRRHQDQARDSTAQKERTLQTRIMDLESQLSQCRAEIAKLRREKEEHERKFNSRLYDIKDRLEQSHSTNRSLQNYVQFMKNSYANVFGDSPIRLPSSPAQPGYP